MDTVRVADLPVVDGLNDAALLGLLVVVVGRLGRQDLDDAVGDDALTGAVEVLHRAETMVAAEKLRRLGAVDARAAYTTTGARSTQDLLGGLGLTHGEARSQVQTAQALGRLPAMADQLARGQLGVAQAGVAARALGGLPATGDDGLDRAAVLQLDRLVATEGPVLDRRQLGRTLDRWAHQQTAGDMLAARERRAHQRRHLWAGPNGDGDLVIEGRLTPIVHAQLGALLDPLARRAGPDDDRTIGQRPHDALATVLGHPAAVAHRHAEPTHRTEASDRTGAGAGRAAATASARSRPAPPASTVIPARSAPPASPAPPAPPRTRAPASLPAGSLLAAHRCC